MLTSPSQLPPRAPPAADGSADYRREARRLRRRWAGQTARLQHALKDLARARDAGKQVTDPRRAPVGVIRAGVLARLNSRRPPPARAGGYARPRHPEAGGEHGFEILSRRDGGSSGPPGVTPGAAGRFGRMVRSAVSDGVLSWSQRQELVRAAGRMGIDRFHAGLVIAAVQYRHAGQAPGAGSAVAARPATNWPATGRPARGTNRGGLIAGAAAAAGVEILLAIFVWRVLGG